MVVIVSTSALPVMVVMMMLMVVVISASALPVMIVMMMLMVVVMSASALLFMIVMMMFMIVVMSASALPVMVVMMMVMMLFLHQFICQRYRMLHNLQDLLSVKPLNRSGNNSSFLIDGTKKLHGLHSLCLVHNICTAHNDRTCILHLIVKELTKVSHIHFALLGIYYSGIAVQLDIHFILYALDCLNYIRKLTYTRWLDEDSIRIIFLYNFL